MLSRPEPPRTLLECPGLEATVASGPARKFSLMQNLDLALFMERHQRADSFSKKGFAPAHAIPVVEGVQQLNPARGPYNDDFGVD